MRWPRRSRARTERTDRLPCRARSWAASARAIERNSVALGFLVVEALLDHHQDEEHGEDEEDEAAVIGHRLLLARPRADEQADDAEQGDQAAPDPLAGTFHDVLPAAGRCGERVRPNAPGNATAAASRLKWSPEL